VLLRWLWLLCFPWYPAVRSVFALWDASELLAVLSGARRGGMFGIVDEAAARVTEVTYNDTSHRSRHEQETDLQRKQRKEKEKAKQQRKLQQQHRESRHKHQRLEMQLA